MTIDRWTEELMQLALTNHPDSKFYCRRWIVVPNVSWGLCSVIQSGREVDLLCISSSRLAHSVEIKVSKADLIADKEKRWRQLYRTSDAIAFEWFAVTEALVPDAMAHAPETAGIIAVTETGADFRWSKNTVARRPVANKSARKLTDSEIYKLMRLGVMRMWSRRSKMYLEKQAAE